MAQTINIYIGESDPAVTDFAVEDSISAIPSPEGMAVDDVMAADDSSAPVPEMFSGMDDDVGIDDAAPSPVSMADEVSDDFSAFDEAPVPADDPEMSAVSEVVPEPEDFEEDSKASTAGKKSAPRKTKS